MSLSLLDIQRENVLKEYRHSNMADAVQKLREEEQEQFYNAGIRRVAENVLTGGLLTSLTVNISNERLSDADFRDVANGILKRLEKEMNDLLTSA